MPWLYRVNGLKGDLLHGNFRCIFLHSGGNNGNNGGGVKWSGMGALKNQAFFTLTLEHGTYY